MLVWELDVHRGAPGPQPQHAYLQRAIGAVDDADVSLLVRYHA